MAFFGDAPLGSADDPDREDGSIGYNGGGVAPQNEYNDIHAAQVVRASTIVPDEMIDDDEENALFAELYKKSEARLQALFEGKKEDISHVKSTPPEPEQEDDDVAMIDAAPEVAPPKTARRNLDDDDYDEYDEEEDEPAAAIERPALVNRHSGTLPSPSKSGSSPAGQGDRSPLKHTDKGKEPATSQEQPKSSEDARKKLEADKKAAEDAVKRSLNTIFYPLDNDRIAMLEQQKLEESEKQIDAEMGGNNTGGQGTNGHGSLSNANLGASSLTLKHLLARIDKKRNLVQASDGELRALINEVRKNRSKWASEDAVGQEELYEAAEKVLSELKAMTEYSAPFLTRVNKRDAPDYAIGKFAFY